MELGGCACNKLQQNNVRPRCLAAASTPHHACTHLSKHVMQGHAEAWTLAPGGSRPRARQPFQPTKSRDALAFRISIQ